MTYEIHGSPMGSLCKTSDRPMVPTRLIYSVDAPDTHAWVREWFDRTGNVLLGETYAVNDLADIVPGVRVAYGNRYILETCDGGDGVVRAVLRLDTGGLYDTTVRLVSEQWYADVLAGNAHYRAARAQFIEQAGALLMGYNPYSRVEEQEEFHEEMSRLVEEYGYDAPVDFSAEIPDFWCRLDHHQYRRSNTCTVRHYPWGVWDGTTLSWDNHEWEEE